VILYTVIVAPGRVVLDKNDWCLIAWKWLKECVQRVIGPLQGGSKPDVSQMPPKYLQLVLKCWNNIGSFTMFFNISERQNQVDHLVAGLKMCMNFKCKEYCGHFNHVASSILEFSLWYAALLMAEANRYVCCRPLATPKEEQKMILNKTER